MRAPRMEAPKVQRRRVRTVLISVCQSSSLRSRSSWSSRSLSRRPKRSAGEISPLMVAGARVEPAPSIAQRSPVQRAETERGRLVRDNP
jgi:hypothetical protein